MNALYYGKVAVLMGGISTEREISLQSGAVVKNALQDVGINAHALDAGRDVLDRLGNEDFTRAFVMLHGRWGEDGVIQGGLELIGMPYTGSGVLASALAMNKSQCKRIWSSVGILTPEYIEITNGDPFDMESVAFDFPLVVKPVSEGSSLGMSLVTEMAELQAAMNKAWQHDRQILIEHYIAGKEYTIGILNDESLPTICVETPRTFYDYEAKYKQDSTVYHCPCGLPDDAERTLQDIALRAYHVIGCRGWGRVDIIVSEVGTPYVLEVNTVPGMTDHSLVPMAARASGLSIQDLVVSVLESSVSGVPS